LRIAAAVFLVTGVLAAGAASVVQAQVKDLPTVGLTAPAPGAAYRIGALDKLNITVFQAIWRAGLKAASFGWSPLSPVRRSMSPGPGAPGALAS
jgi:hypothetical protein